MFLLVIFLSSEDAWCVPLVLCFLLFYDSFQFSICKCHCFLHSALTISHSSLVVFSSLLWKFWVWYFLLTVVCSLLSIYMPLLVTLGSYFGCYCAFYFSLLSSCSISTFLMEISLSFLRMTGKWSLLLRSYFLFYIISGTIDRLAYVKWIIDLQLSCN